MAPIVGIVVGMSMIVSAFARGFQASGPEQTAGSQATKADAPKSVVVKRGSEKPAAGRSGGLFTGKAGVDRLFPAKDPSRVAVASVTFGPGARTVWHSHPLGQTLVVTHGTGWVQALGRQRSRRFGRAMSLILRRTKSTGTEPRRRRA